MKNAIDIIGGVAVFAAIATAAFVMAIGEPFAAHVRDAVLSFIGAI